MSNTSTIILIPFIIAFLGFVFRFYSRERASSMANPSFLLAVGSILIAGLFLVLGVIDMLPAYGTIGFGAVGLILLAVAVLRMFMI